LHELKDQEKVYQPTDRFSFPARSGERLGEDVIRVHEQSRLAYKDSFWTRQKQRGLAPQTRCYLIANKA
jgi:hypothetical protein